MTGRATIAALLIALWQGCAVDSGRDAAPDARDDVAATHPEASSSGAPLDGATATPDATWGCGDKPQGLDCYLRCGAAGLESPTCSGKTWTCAEPEYDPLKMPCYCLRKAWSFFASTNGDCSSAADCVLVGGTGTCECAPTPGEPGGDPISAEALSEAQAYMTAYQNCLAHGSLTSIIACDSAPSINLRCELGRCVADSASCSLADAGSDAAETDATADADPWIDVAEAADLGGDPAQSANAG
jgi:hypothetical protein